MFLYSFLGIPVIADLPVGENLQDHYGTGALAFTVDQPVTLVQTRYENIPSVLKYAMFGSGPLTVLGGVEGMAWIPTKYENRSKDWPDIEFHFVSGSLGSDGGRQVWDQPFKTLACFRGGRGVLMGRWSKGHST